MSGVTQMRRHRWFVGRTRSSYSTQGPAIPLTGQCFCIQKSKIHINRFTGHNFQNYSEDILQGYRLGSRSCFLRPGTALGDDITCLGEISHRGRGLIRPRLRQPAKIRSIRCVNIKASSHSLALHLLRMPSFSMS
jgi:hypothetical protein